MSRAAQQHTRNLTDQQLAQQNQLIAQSNQQGQQDRAAMMPTITSLLNSQGYTPQQQSAITQQSMGAANTAFDALRERAANRMAATNNSAGYGDLTAQLGGPPANISAHLTKLKQAGLITSRTQGRAVYYRLTQPELSALLHAAGQLLARPAAGRRGK